jgi:hypothetical protein
MARGATAARLHTLSARGVHTAKVGDHGDGGGLVRAQFNDERRALLAAWAQFKAA